jgi:hypothetical protein
MKLLKVIAIVLVGYVGLVVTFETLVGVMGSRHADRGVASDEDVAANHWMHRWYKEALERPEVEAEIAGQRATYRAVPVTGDERDQLLAASRFPWVMRLLAGFPPRSFLRLDPR